MNNPVLRALVLLFTICPLSAPAMAQSPQDQPLGDVARRKPGAPRKTPAKVITNDDLSSTDDFHNGAIITATPAKSDSSSSASPTSEKLPPKPGDAKEPAATPDKGKDDKAGARNGGGQLRERYVEQNKALTLLQRELTVAQREYQIQAAEFYADAGTRLRDGQKFDATRKKHEEEMAEKQKQIDQAKQSLEDIKEQGRKAGIPSSAFEQ